MTNPIKDWAGSTVQIILRRRLNGMHKSEQRLILEVPLISNNETTDLFEGLFRLRNGIVQGRT